MLGKKQTLFNWIILTSLEKACIENDNITLDKHLATLSMLAEARSSVWGLGHSAVKAASYLITGCTNTGQFLARYLL